MEYQMTANIRYISIVYALRFCNKTSATKHAPIEGDLALGTEPRQMAGELVVAAFATPALVREITPGRVILAVRVLSSTLQCI